MTRRHKSSKRSSRETRDYSDSEKESGLKDRRSKEDSGSFRVSRESGSIEKRKLDPKDSKDVFNSGNGEYAEEYNSTLKRRKDRTDDGVNDRWNGGEDERTEGSRKSKASSESKSKRRDENEETRSRSEGKHRESSRKETREVERERERKGKEGKSEKFVESEEHNRVSTKSVNEKTELNSHDMLPTPELENQLERRVRRKRDGSGDRDKYEVDIGSMEDKRKDDATNDGKLKDEKHKDERYRDKYRDDVDKEIRHRDDKPTRDHNSNKSDAKYLKDEKSAVENRQKKYKPLDRDRDRDREYENDRDYDLDREFDASRERDHYRDRDRDRDLGHDRSHDRNRDHDGDRDWDRERVRDSERERDRDRDRDRRDRDRDRERERERDRDRDRNRDRDLDHDLDRDFDHDGSQLDERCVKHKDSRGRKRSPDERDNCNDTKSRGVKVHHPDVENKSLSSSRIEPDVDRGRSQSRQGYVDSNISSNRQRTSGSPSSHGGAGDYRLSKQDDIKYRDSVVGKAPLREVTGFSGASERGSKYRSSERSIKVDDGFPGDLLIERSSSSKASPMGIVERSPSSTSLDRRYMSRSGTRRSLDVEESGRRNSAGPRESSVSREIPMEKSLVDESSQMDLMFYNRTSQSNSSSSLPPPPNFRGGIGSPSFMGSMEDDGRVNVGGRYRRSGDPNMGRGQSNMWRGAPNWSSPLPNGFIPFQHGPPPGGFQAMIPQFPSPSMFNVRPPMDINHSGIPYHIADADRFSGHMRPLGWQNVMEGTGPSHLHGWDGSNGVFRDEPLMYGGSDWEQNRHIMNGRGWESVWKGENGDVNMDLPSASQKEDQHLLQPPDDDGSTGKGSEKTQYEGKKQKISVKDVEMTSLSSPTKESSKVVSPKTADDKISAPPKVSSVDHVALRCQFYLSKLDISAELAGTEVYSQCLSVLDMEQTSIDENDTDMIINLKEGGIAVPKSSKILLTPPFFPAASESVFQRAMDHYKKQRVQMDGFGIGNGETMNIESTSDPEKADRGYPPEMKDEESALISDEEMLIHPKSTSEHNKDEAVDDAMQTVEDQISISLSSKAAENLPDTCPQNLELPNESPEEPVLTSNEDINMDETMTNSEHVIPDALDGNMTLPPPNASEADAGDASLPTDGIAVDNEEISKTESDNSVDPVEEKEVMGGDGISGNLRKSDDASPKVADEAMLMPGSNESVVLSSRIHHSPESTH